MEDFVILVDSNDREIGLMEKMQAHREAVLHRAFSIFIFNSRGEMLLQQRAYTKYHTPGLWTNTCCSHPRKGETVADAASRRLFEEMGMICPLEEIFSFIYKANVSQGLIEHELDHILIGHSDEKPVINRDEAASWRYASIETIKRELRENPEKFTAWFKIAFAKICERL